MPGLSHAPESKLSEREARLSYPRAFGAAVGLLAGHRRKWMARHEAQTDVAQQSQQAQQATATEFEKFNKASSGCLEGRDYLVNS